MLDRCFACRNPATTREHVPPLCLFPETKNAEGGRDLRRNLITVPACVDHNLAKSTDDEYFRWVVSTNVAANHVGTWQAVTKVARAHGRRPALGQSILEGAKNVTVVDSRTGLEYSTAEAPLDGARFTRVLDLVALGVYRHHFGESWSGTVRVHPDFIADIGPEWTTDVDTARIVLFEVADRLFAPETKRGDNPDIFWYQVHESRMPDQCQMRLAFYSGCTATALFRSSG
jgi:hypothetical protein